MLTQFTFFTGINQIQIPKITGDGARFAERFFITNNKGRIATIIGKVESNIVSVETGYLSNCSCFVYSKKMVELPSFDKIEQFSDDYLVNELAIVQVFLERLWIIKDNSAFQDRGWLVFQQPKGLTVNNNTWSVRHTNAGGSYDSVEFSHDDLKSARLLTHQNIVHLQNSRAPTPLTNTSLRFQRFMYYIQIARSSLDVAMKISQYCSALEAFVSSQSTELSHQVSERVACILNDPGPERLTTYSKIKKAYNFRSQMVHGSAFKEKDFFDLKDSSNHLDQICRNLIHRYVKNENDFSKKIELKNDDFEKFFKNLIFGIDSL